jgi:protein transport protein SEC31
MLAGEEALVAKKDKHTGAVRALDYNKFQTNLSTAASESEIFIWDLNNTNKTRNENSIAGGRPIYWLESTGASHFGVGVHTLWDLHKNEPIIKLSDTTSNSLDGGPMES